MEGIFELSPDDEYQCKITGFGDIYELMSVRRLRNRLAGGCRHGVIFLASNSEHSGRGYTLEELEDYALNRGYNTCAKGFVDTPPWGSRPRAEGDVNKLMENSLAFLLGKLAIWLLIFFEPLYEGRERSHMVYVAAGK